MLATLTPRRVRILIVLFGICQKADSTLEKVEEAFSVTRERIRLVAAKVTAQAAHRLALREFRRLNWQQSVKVPAGEEIQNRDFP